MAIIIATCPHCLTNHTALQIFGARPFPREKGRAAGHNVNRVQMYKWSVSTGAICPNCSKPVAVLLEPKEGSSGYDGLVNLAGRLIQEASSVDTIGFEVRALWPEPSKPSIPDHTPEAVQRAMLQAERNYPMEGNEEAAAMMYRRTLEVALKDIFPDLKGSLAARIKKLVENNTLPQAMGDWADEIRDLGNDAAHDLESVDRQQLTTIRGFADATLRYLYTLPAEVAARRKLAE